MRLINTLCAVLFTTSSLALADAITIDCGPKLKVNRDDNLIDPKTVKYRFSATSSPDTQEGKREAYWAKDSDATLTERKNGRNVEVKFASALLVSNGTRSESIVLTEHKVATGYRQFYFACRGGCYGGDKVQLTVFKVVPGKRREGLEGPMRCEANAD